MHALQPLKNYKYTLKYALILFFLIQHFPKHKYFNKLCLKVKSQVAGFFDVPFVFKNKKMFN